MTKGLRRNIGSRREFLFWAGAGAASLAGCGGGGSGTPDRTKSAGALRGNLSNGTVTRGTVQFKALDASTLQAIVYDRATGVREILLGGRSLTGEVTLKSLDKAVTLTGTLSRNTVGNGTWVNSRNQSSGIWETMINGERGERTGIVLIGPSFVKEGVSSTQAPTVFIIEDLRPLEQTFGREFGLKSPAYLFDVAYLNAGSGVGQSRNPAAIDVYAALLLAAPNAIGWLLRSSPYGTAFARLGVGGENDRVFWISFGGGEIGTDGEYIVHYQRFNFATLKDDYLILPETDGSSDWVTWPALTVDQPPISSLERSWPYVQISPSIYVGL